MAVEFMVAVKPNAKNLDAELQALKAAVLYADKVSVLSPSFDVYHTLTLKSKNKKNIEIDIINRLLKAVPVCEFVSKDDLTEEHGQLLELQRVSKTPQYRNSSLVERLKIQAILKESQKGTIEDLEDIFGKEKKSRSKILRVLVDGKKVNARLQNQMSHRSTGSKSIRNSPS